MELNQGVGFGKHTCRNKRISGSRLLVKICFDIAWEAFDVTWVAFDIDCQTTSLFPSNKVLFILFIFCNVIFTTDWKLQIKKLVCICWKLVYKILKIFWDEDHSAICWAMKKQLCQFSIHVPLCPQFALNKIFSSVSETIHQFRSRPHARQLDTKGLSFPLWVSPALGRYPGHDPKIVVQLQRQKTPRDRLWGPRRGGRGPWGQGGCQRGTQRRFLPYSPCQKHRRLKQILQKGTQLPQLFSLLPAPEIRKWSIQLSWKRLSLGRQPTGKWLRTGKKQLNNVLVRLCMTFIPTKSKRKWGGLQH